MTAGAQDDIKRATWLARKMVTDYGMSDKLGPRTFGDKQELIFLGREISEQKDYGDKIADAIDEEVDSIIQNAYETARKILTENKPKLIQLAQRLISKETLEGEELESLFNEPVDSTVPETQPTLVPIPAEATTEKAKPRSVSEKAPKYAPTPPKTSPGYV